MLVRRRVRKDPNWQVLVGGGDPFPIIAPPSGSDDDAARNALPDAGGWEPIGGVNTGLMPSTSEADLEIVAGPQNFSASGAFGQEIVIEGKKFTGKVSQTGGKYKFKDCLFNASGTAFDASSEGVQSVVIEDCEFRIGNTNTTGLAAWAHNAVFRRAWIHRFEDGIRPYRADTNSDGDMNFRAYGCVIEKHLYHSPDSAVGGTQPDHQTHCDGVQIHGGYNMQFINCKIVGDLDPTVGDASVPNNPPGSSGSAHISGNINYPQMVTTSAFMFSPIIWPLGDLLIEKCWIGGGVVSLNFGNHTSATGTGITIRNNRWYRTQVLPGKVMLRKAALDPYMTVTGNKWDDNGQAYDTRSNG